MIDKKEWEKNNVNSLTITTTAYLERGVAMNLLTYDQAKTVILVGGTVAVLREHHLPPLILTSESDIQIEMFHEAAKKEAVRFFAYGVKLDKKEEWASQWKQAHTFT